MDAVGGGPQRAERRQVTGQIGAMAPVALFIYRRPEHVRRMIVSLQACIGYAESQLFVFADGPKTEADISAVQATREVARHLLGHNAIFVEQDRNRGLAESIIAGTTELCDRYGSVIVVEEDLVLAPTFLSFLNAGLNRYVEEPRVMQVSGHMFEVPAVEHQQEALFLSLTTSWGWATWKRAWNLFDPYAMGWRDRLADRSESRRFNLGGRYDYHRMLKRQMAGEIDSWAIRWHYTVFAHEGLTLFPPRTLVSNGGLDGSGTHSRLGLPDAQVLRGGSFDLPAAVVESPHQTEVFDAIAVFHRSSAPRKFMALAKHTVRALRA
jgi:hypothetical protein